MMSSSNKISRRKFLRDAALLGIGIAASRLLTGCDQSTQPNAEDVTITPNPNPPTLTLPSNIDSSRSTSAPTSSPTPFPTPTVIPRYTVQLTLYWAKHGGPMRDDEPNLGNEEAPPVLFVDGQTIPPDTDGIYRLRNLVRGAQVTLGFDPEYLEQSGFRYGTPNSNDEVWSLEHGYSFEVDIEKPMILFGLMHGFCTMPTDADDYDHWNWVDLDGRLGYVRNYAGKTGNFDQHQGDDWRMPIGRNVLAMAPGVVYQFNQDEPNPRDPRCIRLKHEILGGNRRVVEIFISDYAHNSKNLVTYVGQVVRRGQKIGEVGDHLGNRGGTTQPHIHSSIWRIPLEHCRDPIHYMFDILPRVQYESGSLVPIVVDIYKDLVEDGSLRFNPDDYPDIHPDYIRSPGYWTVTNDPQKPAVLLG